MRRWALSQGISSDLIVTISDENDRVTPDDIARSIAKLNEPGNLDQLIVYFAGHGVQVQFSEFWLLSDAPHNSQAAVNLAGSVELARQCAIPHVVMISDACRTAAQSLQLQSIRGSDVFPNPGPSGPEKAVDQFWACALGMQAQEILDPNRSAGAYTAVYTEALADALEGRHNEVLRADGALPYSYVRPWPLKDFLPTLLPRHLEAKGMPPVAMQVPDARVVSRPDAWLSRFEGHMRRDEPPRFARTKGGFITAQEVTHHLLNEALQHGETALREAVDGFRSLAARDSSIALLLDTFDRVASSRPPQTLPGSIIVALGPTKTVAPRHLFNWPRLGTGPYGDVAVIRLDSGAITAVPITRDHTTMLTLDESGRSVLSVSLDDTRFGDTMGGATPSVGLSALIVASASLGAFAPTHYQAELIMDKLLASTASGGERSTIMPLGLTAVIHAAYAIAPLGHRDRLPALNARIRDRLGVGVFDISMLARTTPYSPSAPFAGRFPYPLLAQGWPLLNARGMSSRYLEALRKHILPSPWTLFDESAFNDLLRMFRY